MNLGIVFGAPQILLTLWFCLSCGIAISKNGQEKTGKWNARDVVISFVIIFALLIWGGFYN